MLHIQHGTQREAWTHEPKAWAETKTWTLNQPNHPGVPHNMFLEWNDFIKGMKLLLVAIFSMFPATLVKSLQWG